MNKSIAPVSAISWYILLLAIVPAINDYWAFLTFSPSASPFFPLEPTWATVYSAICIVVVLLFLWRGKHRRVVLGTFVLTLFALNLYTDEPSLDRILAFIAYSLLLWIAFEFYRQNIPLYQELKTSRVSIGRILWKASILWSPMVIFVLIGFALSALIVELTKQAIYASSVIDRHCAIQDDPAQLLIPCTNLNGHLLSDQLELLTLKENIATHVERIFFLRKKATLDELSRRSPDQWNDRNAVLQEVARLQHDLRPVSLLGLKATQPKGAPRFASDPQIRALGEQLNIVNAKLRDIQRMIPRSLDSVFRRVREISALQARSNRLTRDLRSRQAFLIKEERARDPVAFQVNSSREALYNDLARINPDQMFMALRKQLTAQYQRKEPPAEIRATLRIAVMQFMSKAESQTQNAITARLQQHPQVAYDVGVVRRQCRLIEPGDDTAAPYVFECPGAPKGPWVLNPLPFRESIDLSIERWHERSERDVEHGLIKSGLMTAKTADDVKHSAEELWRPIPAKIGLGVKSCGLNPGCHISNWAKRSAERAYRKARADLKAKFMSSVRNKADGAALSVNQQIDAARSDLYETLAELRRRIDTAVEDIARGGAVASALLQLWLFLVIVKSVLYVIATEVFNAKSDPVIGLDSQGNAEGAYKRSTNIEIPRTFGIALQTTTVGINQGKKIVVPQPLRAMFVRIALGKWMLNKGTQVESATMRFTQPGGRVGIDWEMKDGEEVVFRYRDLLGFSENLELRTTISLRLSTLLFGRYVYHSARCVGGPGRLLLSVKGDVEAEQDKVETFPLERLIAWNMHARFRVLDERTFAAVFKDGFTIRRVRQDREANGLVLVGAPVSVEQHFQGTIRFVKTFLMPF